MELSIIDVGPLCGKGGVSEAAAAHIGKACRESGFFYAVGHGVDEGLQTRLFESSRQFFELDKATKLAIDMKHGGRAWRGFFPLGRELTSGLPDLKEGLYFGAELAPEHPLVREGTPLHGPNLFPAAVPTLRSCVLDWMAAMTQLGHALTAGISLSLGLDSAWIADHLTRDPLILFRIFHYPPRQAADPDEAWGVGEHTDYGLLTILAQDEAGGLEARSRGVWIDVPPIQGAFVCNIGDMLDRLTGGHYRSTPHRVRPAGQRGRLSLPFFFDPGFAARLEPIQAAAPQAIIADRADRWDRLSVHEIRGTYGEYLLDKVSRVVPELARSF